MVGGNLPGETRTLSVAIYDRMQAFDDRSAGVMAATLLVMAVATLMATTALSRRVGLVVPDRRLSVSPPPVGADSARCRVHLRSGRGAGHLRTVGQRQDDHPAFDRGSLPAGGGLRAVAATRSGRIPQPGRSRRRIGAPWGSCSRSTRSSRT